MSSSSSSSWYDFAVNAFCKGLNIMYSVPAPVASQTLAASRTLSSPNSVCVSADDKSKSSLSFVHYTVIEGVENWADFIKLPEKRSAPSSTPPIPALSSRPIPIAIFVETVNGCFSLSVNSGDTVHYIKNLVCAEVHVSPAQYRLALSGNLEENLTLHQCGINDKDTLLLVPIEEYRTHTTHFEDSGLCFSSTKAEICQEFAPIYGEPRDFPHGANSETNRAIMHEKEKLSQRRKEELKQKAILAKEKQERQRLKEELRQKVKAERQKELEMQMQYEQERKRKSIEQQLAKLRLQVTGSPLDEDFYEANPQDEDFYEQAPQEVVQPPVAALKGFLTNFYIT